jgi:hypothetical protein
MTMASDHVDQTEWTKTSRSEDRRLWWQKLADGIADVMCGAIRFVIECWKAWNWRSRWWRNDDYL